MHIHKGLLLLDDVGRVRVAGGVVDHLHRAVVQRQAVAHAGGGGDDVQVKLTLDALGDDLHVQQPQKAAAEAKAQRRTRLQLKRQRCVVQLQLLQRILQIGVACAVRRVDAAKDHGLYLAVAGQRLRRGAACQGDGVAHTGILHGFDACRQVADLACLQLPAGGQAGGTHVPHLYQRKLCAGGHQTDGVARLYRALKHTDVNNDALVAVVNAVKNQRLERGVRVAGGCGDVAYHTLKHLVDVHACFCRHARGIHARQTDDVLHLLCDLVRVRTGQIDLVQNRHKLKVMLQRHVGVGKGLRLNALRGVHHQYGALAGGKAA